MKNAGKVYKAKLSGLVYVCAVLWCGLFLSIVPARADQWVMSLQKDNLAPFKHRNGYGPGGINVDIITAIAHEIGVDMVFKDYPIDVGREKFLTGELTVDCCLNEIWFPVRDQTVHIFSDPIYKLIEVFVFPKGKVFDVPNTTVLRDKRVGGIKGFTYPNQQDYGERIDANSPLEVLQLLNERKVDVAVLERHAASFNINQHKFKVQFGDPYYSVKVGVRLHKSQADKIDDVNKAIAKLKSSGVIEDIIQRNIR
ncbi:MAG: transporter substrate-binding domain-containing protein [Methylocystaceae bacterium]|nr:transporter substrate-binding domain-containing protein [Methylocystaceae bacterium]